MIHDIFAKMFDNCSQDFFQHKSRQPLELAATPRR